MIKIPHVVLKGNIQIEEIFRNLDPIFIKEDGLIIRVTNSFLSQDNETILVETLVIEEGNKNQFFIVINQREDGIVIRIFPGTDVEKTDGIKRSLAELAKQILSNYSTLKVGKTNLQDFL